MNDVDHQIFVNKGSSDRVDRQIWLWVGVLVPAALMAGVLISFIPDGKTESSEALPPPRKPMLEALCFDDQDRLLGSLRHHGDCPAPSVVKLFFVSPPHAPKVTVAAFSAHKTHFMTSVFRPRRRRMVPRTVALIPGQTVKIMVDTESPSPSESDLRQNVPVLRIRGVAR